MRFNTLLLSSAALLATGTVGLAADLPSKKAAPVEFVRVCSQFGAGFFYIPGSDTCLKVGGRIRAEYNYTEPFARSSNTTSTRARGYLSLDSFTATDWGPVRATTRVFVTRDSGRVTGGSGAPTGTVLPSGTDANVTLDWAYIQFAGFTAGRVATSFFEFAPFGGVSLIGGGGALGRGSDYGSINALAYTATFGGGFSATLALEDGTERRLNLGGVAPADYAAGHVLPDVVGRLDYNGTWGGAQLTGAVHQIRTLAAYGSKDAYGFAIQGGVKVNLPGLAPGDVLYLQAAYSDGASSYTGWGKGAAGTVSAGGDDATLVNGSLKTVQAYSVTGGLRHFFTPSVDGNIYAAYGEYKPTGVNNDYAAFSVGANVRWFPVKDLQIVPGVEYFQYTKTPTGVGTGAGNSKSNWAARLRIQRDF